MRLDRRLPIAALAALVALPLAAQAQPVNGLYIAAGGGVRSFTRLTVLRCKASCAVDSGTMLKPTPAATSRAAVTGPSTSHSGAGAITPCRRKLSSTRTRASDGLTVSTQGKPASSFHPAARERAKIGRAHV